MARARIPNWLYSPTRARRAHARASAGPSRRGAALIMVTLLLVVLAAMAADLQNATQVNLRLAANARDRLQAHFHARSAVQLELFFLRYASLLSSTIGQFIPIPLAEMSSYFVSSDTMKGLLIRDGKTPEDDNKKGSFAEDKPFGDFQGSFWIESVEDENRKVNVSKQVNPGCMNQVHLLLASLIAAPRFDPLFESIGDSRDALRNRIRLLGEITDFADGDVWLDRVCALTGEAAGAGGSTEDTHYDHLPYGAKYKPKNGPLRSLAELRLVPMVNDAFMQLFSDSLTVWTDSPSISVKSANDQLMIAVIYALMGRPPQPGDDEKLKKFFEARNLMRLTPGLKLDESTFKALLTAAGIPVDESRWQLLVEGKAQGPGGQATSTSPILTFKDPTPVYRLTAVGRVGDTTSTMTVVWRDAHKGGAGEIMYWRED